MFANGGAAVPNQYKGFSKLPEEVQMKMNSDLARKYDAGGGVSPQTEADRAEKGYDPNNIYNIALFFKTNPGTTVEDYNRYFGTNLNPEEFKIFQEKIREQIVHQDLYMLQVCDTNLINFDGTAGAGTFGEAQISALKNQQVFLWLTNGMKLSNVSPWLLPSVTKVLVDDELWPFLGNFK